MKVLRFKHHGHLLILSEKTLRSKAWESVCLLRFHLPPIVPGNFTIASQVDPKRILLPEFCLPLDDDRF
jgi:hypothetical protein